MLDFNRSITKARAASDAINAVIDAAIECEPDAPRDYLGGSALGKACLRQLQWDWRKPAKISGKTRGIFARGHWAESYTVSCMVAAGFRMARDGDPRVEFSQMDGRFKGHADGLILSGPSIDGVTYPCLWEHKCLGEKGWAKVGKDGLKSAYPTYYAQVQIYMAYLSLEENPAIFTAVNANTMERLHLLVPFDPETAQEWSDKAVQILSADAAGETLPRVTDNPQDWRCKWCNHHAECWNA